MAGARYFKDVEKQLAKLGYAVSHQNAKAMWVYSCSGREDVAVNPSLSENAARHLVQQLQKTCGTYEAKPKRNATAVKNRQAVQRDLDAMRLAAERVAIEAQHAEYLARIGAAPLTQANRADLARIERRLAEIRELERLMVCVPASAEHRGTGQVRHRAGVR